MTDLPSISRSIAMRTVAAPDPAIETVRTTSALLDSLAYAMREYGSRQPRFTALYALANDLRLFRDDYVLTTEHTLTINDAGYASPKELLDHVRHTAARCDTSFACVANAALMLRAHMWISKDEHGTGKYRKPRGDRGDFPTRLMLFVRPERAGVTPEAPRRGRPPADMSTKKLVLESIEKLSRFPLDKIRAVAETFDLDPMSCIADKASALNSHRAVHISYPHAAALADIAHAMNPENPPEPLWLASRLLERALANAKARRDAEAAEAAVAATPVNPAPDRLDDAPPVFACKEDDPDYDPEDDAEAEAKLMEGI